MLGYNDIELMLKQISEARFVELFEQTFQNTNYLSKREVTTTHGVADLVLLRPVDKKVAIREAHMQSYKLTSESFFSVLNCLPDLHKAKKGATFQDIANHSTISKNYLKQKVLRKLIDEGFVVDEERGYFKINGWLPLANKVIAYEAKLFDWKQGLYQANRYRYFADEAYLVMPAETVHRAKIEDFERLGIGLVGFDHQTNSKNVLVKPSTTKQTLDLPRRYSVMEQFLDQMLNGRERRHALSQTKI